MTGSNDTDWRETDELAARRWPEVIANIDALIELADHERRWATLPGTPMAGDDRASQPFQQSHAFQMLLAAGVDNLNGVRHLTFASPRGT